MIVEGAAALALAGFKKVAQTIAGETSIIVLCGANYNQNVITMAIWGS